MVGFKWRIKGVEVVIHTFHLTYEDVRVCDNYALRWGARNGHLEVLKWLVKSFI